MKHSLLISALIFFSFHNCHAQEIELKPNFFGYNFVKDGTRLTWKDVLNTTQPNVEAYNYIKKAKTNHTVSAVLSFAGGFLIGVPIGQSIGKGEPNWTLAYIGGGLAGVSIPFYLSAVKNAKEGLNTYNQSLHSAHQNPFNPEFKFKANGNGIGLSMNF